MRYFWLSLAFLCFLNGISHAQTSYPIETWQAPVKSAALLPLVGNYPGDARVDQTLFHIWVWNGTAWQDDTGGSGTVTDITAAAPIYVSNPTTTPNITLAYTGSLITVAGVLQLNGDVSPLPTYSYYGTDPIGNEGFFSLSGFQPTGSYITNLTGDVTANGPGSVAATIQPNVVTNAKLAQMPANTIKGNNTGITANASDLTAAQATAMLNAFVGDSGSGGTKGLVPAPPTASAQYGYFPGAGGSWQYVDQSDPIQQPFTYLNSTLNPVASLKANNVNCYTGIDGNKQYCLLVGTASGTISIFDVTDQTIPSLIAGSTVTGLLGAYNVAVATISGHIYALIAPSGGYVFYIYDITNPASPTLYSSSLNWGNTYGSAYNIAYSSLGYAAIATQSKGLLIVDIGGGGCSGTLAAPVACYTQAGGAKSFGVAWNGSTIYTTQYSTSPYTTHILNSWSFNSGTGQPTLLQAYTIPGNGSTHGETLAVSVNPTTNKAFVSETTNVQQVDIIDITTPSAMSQVSYITIPNTIGPAMVAIPVGNYIIMPSGGNASYGGWLGFYDVTTAASPYLIATSTTPTSNATSPFGGISIVGGYIFVGDYGTGGGSLSKLDIFTAPVFQGVNGTLSASAITTNTVNYTAATPANWSPNPTTLESALDQLAARTITSGGTVTAVTSAQPLYTSNPTTTPNITLAYTGSLITVGGSLQLNGDTTPLPTYSYYGTNVGGTEGFFPLPSATSLSLPNSDIFVGNASNIATAVSMSGDATISSTGVLSLATTGVTPGSYINATVTVNAKGLLTSAITGTGESTTITNDPITGTTVNTLAKLTALGQAIITTTTDTGGVVGVVTAGAGTTGSAVLGQVGIFNCVFDGATIAADYFQISSSVAGDCHDAGATYPTSGQILGRVLSTNGIAGDYSALFFSPEIKGTSGGGGSSTPVIQVESANYNVQATDSIVEFTATAIATLPDCTGMANDWVWIISNMSASGVVTIAAGGSNTFTDGFTSGSTSYQLTDPGASVSFDCNQGSVIYVRQ